MVNNIPVNGWPQLKDLEAVQPTLDRLDKIEAWKRTVKEETFTGDDITIENALALPARSLITTINAIQDLNGYDKPWVGGAGKNKLPLSLAYIKTKNTTGTWADNVYTLNGIAYTVITRDGDNVIEIKANGTASANAYLLLFDEGTSGVPDNIKGQDIILSGCPVRSGNPYTVMLNSWGTAAAIYDNGTDHGTATFPANPEGMRCDIEVYSGAELSNVSFYPMVALQSASNPTTFAPYSNLCPISGRTAVAVDDVGKNLTEDKISGCNLMSNGGIITDSTFDMQIAKVKQGETYVITTDDTSGAVYGFFTSKPVQGSTSYNGTRYVTTVKTFTAPITGYVAYRTFANYATPQCEIGTTPTPYQPYAHSSATIQLGQTVYGGSVDFTTGTATVTHAIADMGDLSYEYLSDNNAFRSTSALPGAASENVFVNSISSAYHENQTGMANMANGDFRVQGGIVYLKDFRYTLASDLKTAVTGQTICYELATPIELTLTPTEVQMLKGYNRVTLSDGYGTIELKALTGANWS